jgi:copper resistance protein C
MMRLDPTFAALAMLAAPLVAPTPVLAHTKVVASTPVQGTTVKAPRRISLTFSEALLPPTTAASIVMTAMPSMANHGEMVIRNFTTAWSGGNKTLTLSLKQPLRPGTYEARWQAAGADGHRMKGVVNFVVS